MRRAVTPLIVSLCLLPQCALLHRHGGRIGIITMYQGLEARTVIRKSKIPRGGNGLFALVKIKKYDIIGQYGGDLVSDNDYPKNGAYIMNLPECAWKEMAPYKYIDGADSGAHVTRINFAPGSINGKKTNLQNSYIFGMCKYPYIVVIASRDIEPGEEIYCSYGDEYRYDGFMNDPEIQKYFCGLAGVDCSKEFDFGY